MTPLLPPTRRNAQIVLDALKEAGASAAPYDRAKAVAEAVVAKARECASDSSYVSPYIEEAVKVGKVKSPLGAFAKTIGMTPKARRDDAQGAPRTLRSKETRPRACISLPVLAHRWHDAQ